MCACVLVCVRALVVVGGGGVGYTGDGSLISVARLASTDVLMAMKGEWRGRSESEHELAAELIRAYIHRV